MSLDLDTINGLLNIVKEAAGHPTKLSALGALAMKELEGHNAEAKKAHLSSQSQEVEKPKPVARPAAEFKPETSDGEAVGRRKVSEEVE